MKIIEKIKLINKLSDIFTIKIGKQFKKGNKCYECTELCKLIFRFYYGGLFLFPFFFLLNNPLLIVDNLFYLLIESILILFFLECIFIIFIPLNEVSCYGKK